MSVFIKGINIPESDYIDVRIFPDGTATTSTGTPPYVKTMDVVDVLTPHGRLIDADRLLSERRMHTYYHLNNGDIAIPIIDIKHAPKVIGAEEE